VKASSAPQGYEDAGTGDQIDAFLACLHPERGDPLGTPVQLPLLLRGPRYYFDGDYFYSMAGETKATFVAPLVDLFSANKIPQTITQSLYRLRLPE